MLVSYVCLSVVISLFLYVFLYLQCINVFVYFFSYLCPYGFLYVFI